MKFTFLKKKNTKSSAHKVKQESGYRVVFYWNLLVLFFFGILILLSGFLYYMYGVYVSAPHEDALSTSTIPVLDKKKIGDAISTFLKKENAYTMYLKTPPSILDPSL
jgi:hypothetical protein